MKILKPVLILGVLSLIGGGVYNLVNPIEALKGQSMAMIVLGFLVLIAALLLKNRR